MTNQDIIITGYAVIMLIIFFSCKLAFLYFLISLFDTE